MPKEKKPTRSETRSFGTSHRESHDASRFYSRKLYAEDAEVVEADAIEATAPVPPGEWADRLYCQSSEHMPIPDNAVGLAFTSPPYNVGKDYEADLSLESYLGLIEQVGKEVHRALAPGGAMRSILPTWDVNLTSRCTLTSIRFTPQLAFCQWGKLSGKRRKGVMGVVHGEVGGAPKRRACGMCTNISSCLPKICIPARIRGKMTSAGRSSCKPRSPFGKSRRLLHGRWGTRRLFRLRWPNE